MITVEPYCRGVESELFNVFCSAIKNTCSNDYSPEQIAAWLPTEYDADKWKMRLEGINPYIAKCDGELAGYADVQANGYIDHFFVSPTYQSKGVGRALMGVLLDSAKPGVNLHAHVSITARPFFKKFGFAVIRENTVSLRGVELKNYIMELSRHGGAA